MIKLEKEKKVAINRRERRRKRTHGKVKLAGLRPRLTVFRSSKHIYAQIIDDLGGKVLTTVSDLKMKEAKPATKTELAKKVGAELAKRASEKGISEVVFDRGSYLYHGRVRALAEAAREGGLKF